MGGWLVGESISLPLLYGGTGTLTIKPSGISHLPMMCPQSECLSVGPICDPIHNAQPGKTVFLYSWEVSCSLFFWKMGYLGRGLYLCPGTLRPARLSSHLVSASTLLTLGLRALMWSMVALCMSPGMNQPMPTGTGAGAGAGGVLALNPAPDSVVSSLNFRGTRAASLSVAGPDASSSLPGLRAWGSRSCGWLTGPRAGGKHL